MALVYSLDTPRAAKQSGGALDASSPGSTVASFTADDSLDYLHDHLKEESHFVDLLLAAQEDLFDALRSQTEEARFHQSENVNLMNRLREEEERSRQAEALLMKERKTLSRKASSQEVIIESLHKERCTHLKVCQQKDAELCKLQNELKRAQDELSDVKAELATLKENEAIRKKDDGAPPRASATPCPEGVLSMPSKDAGGTARYGFAFDQGTRRSMEDGVLCVSSLDCPGGGRMELYGVVDGHGGQEAVEYITRCLAAKVTALSPPKKDENVVGDILREAMLSLDSELIDLAKARSASTSSGFSSGACAVIMAVEGSLLTVANCGDCRAVLCRKGSPVNDETLTTDHNASESRERARVESLGVEITSDGYIHGHVAVTRAFGDFAYESQTKCPGVICCPDLFQVTISDDVEFAILACDGVFEVMSAKEAVLEVRRALRQSGSPQAATQALIQFALQKNSTDNVSAVVVVFNAPEPAPERTAPRLFALKPRKAA
eukprot:TRINITY_DN29148_c0_g1_i1.p1 TRINITY_DN29148_c0_g1~~TRINITY_DN29148_c0_g1_i1.p1  ORF type:complete len:505 (+),score=81.85 TRINITY_DN29148_c0_g1_i1:34-1515(+)